MLSKNKTSRGTERPPPIDAFIIQSMPKRSFDFPNEASSSETPETPTPRGDMKATDHDLRSLVRGDRDDSMLHEVTRYVWWGSHEGSTCTLDRSFETQKAAILYVCKQNSDALLRYAKSHGLEWPNLFSADPASPYSLQPNIPFHLETFAALRVAELAEYAERACNAFSRHKVKEGVSYRYQPRESAGCSVEELLTILQAEPDANGSGALHLKRQALLLSDIAGFD